MTTDLEPLFKEDGERGMFYKCLLVRFLRQDRVIPALQDFIRSVESVAGTPQDGAGLSHVSFLCFDCAQLVLSCDYAMRDWTGVPAGWRLPVLGPTYMSGDSAPSLSVVFSEMDMCTPALFLLSSGADPTEAIDSFARKQHQAVQCVAALGRTCAQPVHGPYVLGFSSSRARWSAFPLARVKVPQRSGRCWMGSLRALGSYFRTAILTWCLWTASRRCFVA